MEVANSVYPCWKLEQVREAAGFHSDNKSIRVAWCRATFFPTVLFKYPFGVINRDVKFAWLSNVFNRDFYTMRPARDRKT